MPLQEFIEETIDRCPSFRHWPVDSSKRTLCPRKSGMIADPSGSSGHIVRPSGKLISMHPRAANVGSTSFRAWNASNCEDLFALAIRPVAVSRRAQARSIPQGPRGCNRQLVSALLASIKVWSLRKKWI